MRSIGAAVAALAADPYPPEAFHRGDYHRLHVGRFRVVYVIDGDLITVERVDRSRSQAASLASKIAQAATVNDSFARC
jgi:hypothetical protein